VVNNLFAYEAQELLDSGKIHEAIEICKAGLKEYPKYTIAYSILAHGYFLIQDYYSSISTIEAALERYPENVSLINLRNKVIQLLENNNQFILGDSEFQISDSDTITPVYSQKVTKSIQSEEEITNLYEKYKYENIILTGNEVINYISTNIEPEIFEKINTFENLQDIISSFRESESETEEDDNYFSKLALKIGEGKIRTKHEINKADMADDEPYIVSETMAHIYEIQKAYLTAVRVYEKLCDKYPEKKEKFLEKISELQNKLN
jgi:tetratricopeptide (TPR) repeat protein